MAAYSQSPRAVEKAFLDRYAAFSRVSPKIEGMDLAADFRAALRQETSALSAAGGICVLNAVLK